MGSLWNITSPDVGRGNKNRMRPLVSSGVHHPNSGITHFTFHQNASTYDTKGGRHHIKIRAFREWQEYEQAVKDKDLSRALRFLREDSKDSSIQPTVWSPMERDWQILDTCLNADDMRLVASAYAFLKDKDLLPNFGKYSTIGKPFTLLILTCSIFSP